MNIPTTLKALRSWLVWRLVHIPGDRKPKKIPYYTSGKLREGGQGTDADRASLVGYDDVMAARGYTGIGLAMLRENGLVALDFDNCVENGQIKPGVLALIEGTYSEFSPSGNGVRAFFFGALRDRKDHDIGFEVFHGSGYVTVTGNRTPMCEMFDWDIAPLSEAVLALYRQRFGDERLSDDDWLGTLGTKIGLTAMKARAMVDALDPDCGYQDWLHAGQALHHEFDGSEEALEIWRDWSRKSQGKYPGDDALEAKWASFGRYQGAPITGAWLLKHGKVARVAARYDAVAEWKDKIANATDEFDLREKVCTAIAKDDRLGEIERESLAQGVAAVLQRMGTKLPIALVRKLVQAPETQVPTVKQRRPLTEFGNAERMLDRFGESLMYVPELDAWYCWNGIYWRRATDVEIEHYAKETVRSLGNEASEHNDSSEFYEWCAVSQQARMVRNMVALAASDPRVMVPADELDKHKHLLGVQNGVVDLRDGKLLDPDPHYRITRVCACEYRPGARAALFRQTVLDVFSGDADMADFFQRLIGYAALGDPTEDIMVIAHGNGSNGKSTVLNTIRRALGSYAKTAQAESFMEGKVNAGGPREDLVRLKGSRFVYVSEPEEQSELREGYVKAMTGGDAVPARGLWSAHTIEITPSWVVFMPTNHKPIIKGSDNGIWRRLVLLPFLRSFEGQEKDGKRQEKLEAETEGVLAYIVEGAAAYLRMGLCPPRAVQQARDQYRNQMDLLAEWIEECCEIGPDYETPASSLWASWENYAKTNGVIHYVKSNVALGRRLDGRFESSRSNGVRVRRGIRLKGSGGDFWT